MSYEHSTMLQHVTFRIRLRITMKMRMFKKKKNDQAFGDDDKDLTVNVIQL